ncbi:MAG TPA: aminoglycoside phosphotransferase family protein [Fimbriimonadaceae bacterium]|nr:aminoglycoside phosphotransferase family protein [Fimbriimonadaceae bacterium]
MELPRPLLDHNRSRPDWISSLPQLIADLERRWRIRVGPPFPHIVMNFVAPAEHDARGPCVLKVSPYVDETLNEIAALAFWRGEGAARLLEADGSLGALLIERIQPGTDLSNLSDDEAMEICAGLLSRLWLPAADEGLRPLSSWFAAYDRYGRGDGSRVPNSIFDTANRTLSELIESTAEPLALHGDLHHFNVLRSDRAGWIAIDPKGLYGDRHFDVCQFLRNPHPVSPEVNERRLGRLCELLGLERGRARRWCFVHAVLDALWECEEGNDPTASLGYADQFLPRGAS